MKTTVLWASALLFWAAPSADALDVPKLSGRIVDLGGVIDSGTRVEIENTIRTHEERTSNQIAVLTLSSLEGEPLDDYSVRVAQAWHLGQKDRDNGVLLLVSVKDRKLRIEVGYGLEGKLTDALSNRIIRDEIVPAFKSGNMSAGIKQGTLAIAAAIEGTYQSNQRQGLRSERPRFQRILMLVGLLCFFAYILLNPILHLFRPGAGRSGSSRWGGGWGGGGGFGGGFGGGGGGGFSGGGGSFGGGGSSGSW